MAKKQVVGAVYSGDGKKFTAQEVVEIDLDFDKLVSDMSGIMGEYTRAGSYITKHSGVADEFEGEGAQLIQELNGWSELFYKQLLEALEEYNSFLSLAAEEANKRNNTPEGKRW
ncbi:MAG: hypothetical protein RR422_09610, partial [Erysipelothrix sp.]